MIGLVAGLFYVGIGAALAAWGMSRPPDDRERDGLAEWLTAAIVITCWPMILGPALYRVAAKGQE